MSTDWTPQTWIEQGGRAIRQDAVLGQRMLSHGLKAWPTCGIAWFNLGIAQHQQGKIKGAIQCYRKALALDDSAQLVLHATTNLAQDLLLNGEWQEGFEMYEQRLTGKSKNFSAYRQIYGEPWSGWADPRPCKQLMIVGEQGYMIRSNSLRLIQTLKDEGFKTSYFGPEALRLLLGNRSRLGPFPSMLCNEENKDTLWCPLMSLPHRLKLDPSKIPLSEGYLKADTKRVNYWSKILKRSSGKRLVALHWQGNPRFERSIYSQGRSMSLKVLSPLGDLRDIEFLSVQKGEAAKEIKLLFQPSLGRRSGNIFIDNGLSRYCRSLNLL